jgi:hypothetical protein
VSQSALDGLRHLAVYAARFSGRMLLSQTGQSGSPLLSRSCARISSTPSRGRIAKRNVDHETSPHGEAFFNVHVLSALTGFALSGP